jgi:hypothetical protein
VERARRGFVVALGGTQHFDQRMGGAEKYCGEGGERPQLSDALDRSDARRSRRGLCGAGPAVKRLGL